MQFSKALALSPAPASAAWRSQSVVSRLELLGLAVVVVLSLVWVGGGGLAHAATNIAKASSTIFMRFPLREVSVTNAFFAIDSRLKNSTSRSEISFIPVSCWNVTGLHRRLSRLTVPPNQVKVFFASLKARQSMVLIFHTGTSQNSQAASSLTERQ